MKKSIASVFVSVLAAALLAGCNNNTSSNNNNGLGSNCGNPAPGFRLLYPRNNAPHVSPSISAVYVAFNPTLPGGNSYNLAAQLSGGGSQFTSTFATYSGPLPNPHNPVPAGSTVYFTQFAYPIGPLQTVQLFWNDGGTGCTPNTVVGTFTTS